jgi:K+-sensing histidine kinase KdpD
MSTLTCATRCSQIMRRSNVSFGFLSNLLEAARIEAGALRPSRVRVPVEELCRASGDDARPSLGSRLVEIHAEPHLTPIDVHETTIRQALVDLLENAAHCDAGPLEVRAARVGCFLEIRSSTTGGEDATEREISSRGRIRRMSSASSHAVE